MTCIHHLQGDSGKEALLPITYTTCDPECLDPKRKEALGLTSPPPLVPIPSAMLASASRDGYGTDAGGTAGSGGSPCMPSACKMYKIFFGDAVCSTGCYARIRDA